MSNKNKVVQKINFRLDELKSMVETQAYDYLQFEGILLEFDLLENLLKSLNAPRLHIIEGGKV